MTVHILRLAFGIETIERLRAVLESRGRTGADGRETVVITTRNKPRRAAEIADGGSLYWIVKGQIRARQRIVAIEEYEARGQDGGPSGRRRCTFRLDPELVLTVPTPRRPHQGWRYLKPDDAPADLDARGGEKETPPAELAAELRELGLLF
ncbi:MAG: DUF1489 family protein [Sphingomonadales bacterium]